MVTKIVYLGQEQNDIGMLNSRYETYCYVEDRDHFLGIILEKHTKI